MSRRTVVPRRIAASALVAMTLVGLTGLEGCGDGDGDGAAPEPAGASSAAFPDDVTAYIDQSRLARIGRSVFIRLVNEGERTITVTRAEISSERFEPVTWTGDDSFTNEVDLEFELPPGTCGTGSDADVRLTYRLDDGPELVSTTRATDRYGAIAFFLDRDCAERTLEEAADLTVGEHRVVGTGPESYFELPVTFTATGARDDVAFAGFARTVLFSLLDGTAAYPTAPEIDLVEGVDTTLTLRLVPSRCDPHALAEDKVGTLIGVHVVGPGLPKGASFYLPISDDARGDLRGFFAVYCEL